jgi:hypothetical protein
MYTIGMGVSSCACTSSKPVSIESSWPASDKNGTAIVVRSACAGCGVVFDPTGHELDADHRARLAAREQIGRFGTWSNLGLPSVTRLGDRVGARSLVVEPPNHLRFFPYDFEALAPADLRGAVRSRLGLSRSLWPRAIITPAWDRPVIVHHGLVEKFTTKLDNMHLHLVALTQRTIEQPVEAWTNDYDGAPNLHLMARYRLPHSVVTHLVCADTRTALCMTQYILTDDVEDDKRNGVFQYASWAAPR